MNQRQKGEICNRVRAEVRERSGGVCEVRRCCGGAFAVNQAHIIGRKQIDWKTTANDLLDSCADCHNWMDRTIEGIRFKRSLVQDGIASHLKRNAEAVVTIAQAIESQWCEEWD
ncbi:hypothetical protein [Paenibacillus cymbidii]|uniref:hypothetical protein n=1 Tax=Paenibacillus cymbidii TaxID=1639034 RepID=UPI001080A122|nr:hypothetical protein [Paenibacillus cymbidii]